VWVFLGLVPHVLIDVTSTLSSEGIYFLDPNELVGVKVSLKSFSINVTCSYIPPGSDLKIYEQYLSAIKTVLSQLSERDLLISWVISISLTFLGSLPLTNSTPLSGHDFVDGLLELSFQQDSCIRNSLNRQLDLVFLLDPTEVTVSRID